VNKYKVTKSQGSREILADRITPMNIGVGFFNDVGTRGNLPGGGRREELVAFIPLDQLTMVEKIDD